MRASPARQPVDSKQSLVILPSHGNSRARVNANEGQSLLLVLHLHNFTSADVGFGLKGL